MAQSIIGTAPDQCPTNADLGAMAYQGLNPVVETIKAKSLSTYADNTAALAGGLVAGQFYKTSTGVLMVVY